MSDLHPPTPDPDSLYANFRPGGDPLREAYDRRRRWSMQPLGQLVPAVLPGFTLPQTFATWPVWRDSAREDVRWLPLPRKEAAKRWHKARRFDAQTRQPGKHGGAIGRTALCVLYVMLFDFLNHATGRLDPSYAAIAKTARCCERTAKAAVKRLRELGLLHWQRRCREDKDEAGRFMLVQETNAYAVLPPSHWRGYYEPPPAPPPAPGTWGDHPPLPDPLTQAAEDMRQGGSVKASVAVLELDPADRLAAALAQLGRTLSGAQS